MSSFHKIVDLQTSVCGTKTKNAIPYVSSGIPSLDYIIGGGLPTGAIFAIEEDILGNYSKVLNKYFLAEGVACKHDLLIASIDEEPKDIVKELPKVCIDSSQEEIKNISNDVDKMKIAWRYEGLNQVESSFGNKSNFGHNFDLSKCVDAETIQTCNITYWNPTASAESVTGFRNKNYYSLLTTIKQSVAKDQYQTKSKENKNVLRISILSLGSPTWMAMDCEEEHSTHYGQDLIKFIYCLRVILRDTVSVAFVTIPSHLFTHTSIMNRILYSVDNAVRIESFSGSSKETNSVYKDYHGLFHITKLSSINSLQVFVPPSLDLAFKMRRKKFIIEKLHLPPGKKSWMFKKILTFLADLKTKKSN